MDLLFSNFHKKGDNYMKKYLYSFAVILVLLTGCSQPKVQETTVSNPYEILVENELLSYYDAKDDINVEHFIVSDNVSDMVGGSDKADTIIVNEDGSIRCISITSELIKTYNQISVGDSVTKITEAFENEYQSGNNYMVIFDGSTEEEPTNQDKNDDWIWINYITDGSYITQIQIYDVKFGAKMK